MSFYPYELCVTLRSQNPDDTDEMSVDLLAVELDELKAAVLSTFGGIYVEVDTDDGNWEGVQVSGTTIEQLWKLAKLATESRDANCFMAWAGILPGGLASLDPETAIRDFRREFEGDYEDLAEYGHTLMEDEIRHMPILDQFFNFAEYGKYVAADHRVVELSTGRIAVFGKG
ncbi:antirestriction protein ArdA [Streptosporangium sp. NPDC050855]|uniref:antirestriction protein ArdA n=1 Tax=Streptosporangium sp. NPDC050855 TaxID=3366194 RepID=UPI0037B0FAD9